MITDDTCEERVRIGRNHTPLRADRKLRLIVHSLAATVATAEAGMTRNVTRTCGDLGNVSNSRVIDCKQSRR